MTRGRFITFEGGEGVGKSTHAGRLADVLRARGITARRTREPGGSPGAEDIRQLLVTGETTRWDAMTEALLNFAARRDHLITTVWPALERGDVDVQGRTAVHTGAGCIPHTVFFLYPSHYVFPVRPGQPEFKKMLSAMCNLTFTDFRKSSQLIFQFRNII